mmetsp:Transcript_27596/g.88562  ORF Transcript_27596/g.88562 Transcript_27596/m.88562 type:complete len:216 (+) Transcript_27596:135-782(+)
MRQELELVVEEPLGSCMTAGPNESAQNNESRNADRENGKSAHRVLERVLEGFEALEVHRRRRVLQQQPAAARRRRARARTSLRVLRLRAPAHEAHTGCALGAGRQDSIRSVKSAVQVALARKVGGGAGDQRTGGGTLGRRVRRDIVAVAALWRRGRQARRAGTRVVNEGETRKRPSLSDVRVHYGRHGAVLVLDIAKVVLALARGRGRGEQCGDD